MKIPYRWVKEFVHLDLAPEQAADRLVNAGIEVASVTPLRPAGLGGVVVGAIEAIERDVGESKHGYRLFHCRVWTGRERFAVVCGAPNTVAGVRAAFAPPGATLPGRGTIGAAKLHGVESQGMLCSERELGIGEEHERGILLLDADAPVGADLVEHLGLDDVALEVEITPNRPDCLAVVGIARELAALTGGRFRAPAIALEESREPARRLARVRIEDPELCPRYAARVISGVRVALSPAWLAARLRAVGLRPISNVVDATNYVLWELGHPLHAFDYQTVAEATIVVRRARSGERLTTLDGQTRALTDSMLVIADAERAIALAGVMGGANTEVTGSTTRVLLESAYFKPASIRRTARAFGLQTDAAYRFERGADIEGLRVALDRAAELIGRVAGGAVARGAVDAYPRRRRPSRVRLRMSRVERVLGVAPPRREAKRILNALGLPTSDAGRDLVVEVPSFRRDIAIEDDLVEEVIRVWGYDRIPTTSPTGAITGVRQPEGLVQEQVVRQALVGAGLAEVVTYSFGDPGLDKALGSGDPAEAADLLNPLSQDASRMRRHPLEGVLGALVTNLRRQQTDASVFEFCKTFSRASGGFREERWVAVALTGERVGAGWWKRGGAVDVYDAKGLAEHVLGALGQEGRTGESLPWGGFEPDSSAVLAVGERVVAQFGEVAADLRARLGIEAPVFAAALALDELGALPRMAPRYAPLPRFPSVQRDLAFAVDAEVAVNAHDLEDTIRREGGPLLRRVELFDLFRFSDGRRSLAWRLTFQAEDRTLTDAEVNAIQERVATTVTDAFRVTWRRT